MAVLAAACLGSTLAARCDEPGGQESVKINKIFWCIHPYCWSMHQGIPEGRDPDLWNAVLAWELRVHQLHMDFVSNMKPDEALIIYPIGSSEPMSKLLEHAHNTLGARCIVPTWRSVDPDFLKDVPDPIHALLENDDLPGKKEFVHAVLTDGGRREEPESLAAELEAEIREACEVIGYDWSFGALEVIYYNRVLALEIQEEFGKRGLVYDPQTVECVAFGEGLEQCAMTWKAMLPHYMGLAKPIENDPALSVSGAAFLVNAKFRERIALADDVRLLLWEGEDGRPIALFYRAADRLGNRQLYAHVPLAGLSLEAWILNDKHFTADATSGLPSGHLHVPVFRATRTGGYDYSFYLIANGISLEDFRSRLAGVEITTEAR